MEGGKTCTKCKLYKLLTSYYSDKGKKDGLVGCCKSCFDKLNKKYIRTRIGRYITYKRHAKQRGYEFNITFNEFITFWNMDCTYCGDSIRGIRLDRTNNSIGYTYKNVTPCCKKCNYAKRQMSVMEYITHCHKVASKHKKNKSGIIANPTRGWDSKSPPSVGHVLRPDKDTGNCLS